VEEKYFVLLSQFLAELKHFFWRFDMMSHKKTNKNKTCTRQVLL